jgi:hypothetical protein
MRGRIAPAIRRVVIAKPKCRGDRSRDNRTRRNGLRRSSIFGSNDF